MKKELVSQFGFFNPCGLLTFALCSTGALLALLGFAANPPSRPTPVQAGSQSFGLTNSVRTFTVPAGVLDGGSCLYQRSRTPIFSRVTEERRRVRRKTELLKGEVEQRRRLEVELLSAVEIERQGIVALLCLLP